MHSGVQWAELLESDSTILVRVNSTMIGLEWRFPLPSRSGCTQAQLPMRLTPLPQHRGCNFLRTARSPSARQFTFSVLHTATFQTQTAWTKEPVSSPNDKAPLSLLLYKTNYQHINALLLKHTYPAVLACAFSLPVACSLVSLNFLSKAYSLTYAMWH